MAHPYSAAGASGVSPALGLVGGRVWLGREAQHWHRLLSSLHLDPEVPLRQTVYRGGYYCISSFWKTTKLTETEVSSKSKLDTGKRDPQPHLKQNSVLHGHVIWLHPVLRSTIARHPGHLRHRLHWNSLD